MSNSGLGLRGSKLDEDPAGVKAISTGKAIHSEQVYDGWGFFDMGVGRREFRCTNPDKTEGYSPDREENEASNHSTHTQVGPSRNAYTQDVVEG